MLGLEAAIKWVKATDPPKCNGRRGLRGTVVRLKTLAPLLMFCPARWTGVCGVKLPIGMLISPAILVHIGDKAKVIVKEIDSMGRINSIHQSPLGKPEGYVGLPLVANARLRSFSRRWTWPEVVADKNKII